MHGLSLISEGRAQVKSIRPVVTYRKHSQRRVASPQSSKSDLSRKRRELLATAPTPPQATTLYNGVHYPLPLH